MAPLPRLRAAVVTGVLVAGVFVAICLSILLVANLTTRGATRSAGGVRRLRQTLLRDPGTRPRRRAHAPPDRWVLSVCRC